MKESILTSREHDVRLGFDRACYIHIFRFEPAFVINTYIYDVCAIEVEKGIAYNYVITTLLSINYGYIIKSLNRREKNYCNLW